MSVDDDDGKRWTVWIELLFPYLNTFVSLGSRTPIPFQISTNINLPTDTVVRRKQLYSFSSIAFIARPTLLVSLESSTAQRFIPRGPTQMPELWFWC